MTPTHTEIVVALLDNVLGERFGDKLANLRLIERTAKRMADQVERRIARENSAA